MTDEGCILSTRPYRPSENFKNLKTASYAYCAFLQSPGDIFNCSICLMPVFGVGNVYRFWIAKRGSPVFILSTHIYAALVCFCVWLYCMRHDYM